MTNATDQPLLIDVPDGVLTPLASAEKPDDVERALRKYVEITSEEGTLIGKPRRPIQSTASRFPRFMLSYLLRLADQKFPTLRDCGLYIQRTGSPTILERALFESVYTLHGETGTLLYASFASDPIDRSMVAFLNLLYPTEQHIFEDNGSIPLERLSFRAKQKLGEVIRDPEFSDDDHFFLKGWANGYVLRSDVEREHLLYITNDSGGDPVATLDNIAWLLQQNESGSNPPTYSGRLPAQSKLFVPLLSSRVRLTLSEASEATDEEARDGGTYVTQMTIGTPLASRPLSLKDLPEPVREEFSAAYRKLKK
ncbi:hypothetical protein BH11ARM2_BH11ARM2_04520 [soil metagenome]